MIRCKAICTEKTFNAEYYPTEYGVKLKLAAATTESMKNEKSPNRGPAGTLNLCAVNSLIADQLEVGKEYYFDINPVAAE